MEEKIYWMARYWIVFWFIIPNDVARLGTWLAD